MPRLPENLKPIVASKELSGAQRRGKRKLEAEEDKKQADLLKKFMTKTPTVNVNNNQLHSTSSNETTTVENVASGTVPTVSNNIAEITVTEDFKLELHSGAPIENSENEAQLTDPSTWPTPLNLSQKNNLVLKGPIQKILKEYPAEVNGRKFNAKHYEETSKSGEKIFRDWILYSQATNSLFCFPCCLFSDSTELSPWSNYGSNQDGFKDFTHQARGISKHEESQAHFGNVIKWKEYKVNIQKGNIVSLSATESHKQEISFWKNVLKGILNAVIFLSKNNLAFLGKSTNIRDKNCGNFLSLIQLLSQYDPHLAIHVERIQKGKVSYLSPKIQNQFINLAGSSVRTEIINDIRSRTYFSIMFDATPDASHNEQLSQIIRTVNVSKTECVVEENFIDFVNFDEKTGLLISQEILRKIEADGLDIKMCRGQGYDNGSNMAGIYQGVQARIIEVNPQARFIPCASHSLNLVGHHAATKIFPAKQLLNQIQNLYNFFSGSTPRWTHLKKHVKKTLKKQSETRWSSKAEAVTTVFEEFETIGECLVELSNLDSGDAILRFDDIWNFKFLLGLTIWDFILSRIEITNKTLQLKGLEVDAAALHIKGLVEWLITFKENEFLTCFEKAKTKAEAVGIECNFATGNRKRRLPRRFKSMETEPSSTFDTDIEKYKKAMFDALTEKLLEEFSKRFKEIKSVTDNFSFLWGNTLNASSSNLLSNSASDLADLYDSDFDKERFVKESVFLKSAITPFLDKHPLSETSALQVLNVLVRNGLQEQFHNCTTALRIFLTLPVSVASNERAFSKLKIIKNYLRSSMGQERLSNLSILSIEHEYVSKISFDKIIHDFATQKCRKVNIL